MNKRKLQLPPNFETILNLLYRDGVEDVLCEETVDGGRKVHKYRCPICGNNTGVPILRGYPRKEAVEAAKRDEVRLGGCIIRRGDPTRQCTACGCQWLHKRKSTPDED